MIGLVGRASIKFPQPISIMVCLKRKTLSSRGRRIFEKQLPSYHGVSAGFLREITMHKTFISYHHNNDQWYKEELVKFGEENSIFVDRSVDTGDISDDLSDETIRQLIRDEYLRDSTITIVLVGTETKHRKTRRLGNLLKYV